MQSIRSFAIFVLTAMFLLMLGSIWNDSATMDEMAHIPAGYSYVTLQDYRLNPEHPPLLKSMAGIFTRFFVNPYFPIDTPYWQKDINGQWAQGAVFLYESGNDADRIIFWSRFPFLLLTVIFGWMLFEWVKRRFNSTVALLTLIFFAFSPTILAHGRLVTTDVGAAFGFFVGIITFIKFLETPSWRTVVLAGIGLGLALLLKFSTILLLPTYAILFVTLVWVLSNLHMHERIRVFFRILGQIVMVGAVAILLVWTVYAYHVWNYPPERQLADAEFTLTSFGYRPAVHFNLTLIKNEFTRPLGQYLFGLLMVIQRSAGGNTAFFLGEVSSAGSRLYFPLLYILKESLAFHLFTLIAFVAASKKIFRSTKQSKWRDAPTRVRIWIREHFVEFASIVFIAVYWAASIKSPLNIGVRHVLPTFPFIYLLVARQITDWLHSHAENDPHTWVGWLKNIYQIYIKAIPKFLISLFLLVWLVIGAVTVFPHFLSYYNELAPLVASAASSVVAEENLPLTGLAGGTRYGWHVATDSNYDWGQDLKRLTDFVEKNNIQKIAVDYFGGGSPRYYLGEKFEPWRSSSGTASGWFAISATFRQGAFGTPVAGFERRPEDSYEWLRDREPVARVGYSIFVYKLP